MLIPSDQDASGRDLGAEELELLAGVIASGTLIGSRGTAVKALEASARDLLGAPFAIACSSGTAALHAAIATLGTEPGDEIVTSSITDMGAIVPILFQAAVPVFADVDPLTGNVTADTIEARLGPRTRAVIVTHLFGNPCRMEPIRELADSRGLTLIEDCAQAYLAESEGRMVGTVGDIGCFSLQQGKHATCGEGGIIVTGSPTTAEGAALFVNKGWNTASHPPDHQSLALNYRMSELQAAVAVAQLAKVRESVRRRIASAERLSRGLDGLEGIAVPRALAGDVHSYWRYAVMVDPERISGGPVGLAGVLAEKGIASAPRYIRKPAFECEVIREQRTFGTSRFPFSLARPEAVDYAPARYPGTYRALEEMLVLPWTEQHSDAHADHLAEAFRQALGGLSTG